MFVLNLWKCIIIGNFVILIMGNILWVCILYFIKIILMLCLLSEFLMIVFFIKLYDLLSILVVNFNWRSLVFDVKGGCFLSLVLNLEL